VGTVWNVIEFEGLLVLVCVFAFVYAMFSLMLGQFRSAEQELGRPPAESPGSRDADDSPVDRFYREIAEMEHEMGFLPHNSDEVISRCPVCRRANSGE
jgi:hypothetical protein